MSGLAYESVAWIYKMFITFVVAIIAIGIVGITMKTDADTIELQKELLLNRILYGTDSIWYNDENLVVYPGIVDITKFDQKVMDANFVYPPNYGSAKIALYSSSATEPIYINKATYDGLRPTILAGVARSGHIETHNYPVTIRRPTGDEKGYMSIELVMPEQT